MEWRNEKNNLYRHLILSGTEKKNFSSVAKKVGGEIPKELLEKWEKRFYRSANKLASGFEFPDEPRLINRFCIGADPEFILSKDRRDSYGNLTTTYIHAESVGLNTVDAFGCDMAGRQAELRAYPSRFVVETVASLIDTLRWMNEAHALSKYEWIAPASYSTDGCGGHVHVGRKRGSRDQAISSLDTLTKCLLKANVLDAAGQTRRYQSGYGRPGDYRIQTHGYEYRTMPTWMSSPWAAYLTLVLSKLAVLENLSADSIRTPERTIFNLLRAYQARDDDAKIALIALERKGLPKFEATDFKERWGVGQEAGLSKELDRYYFPPIIEAEPDTSRELFAHLVSGTEIKARLPKPMWRPFELPMKVFKPHFQAHTYGVPDIASGLLSQDYRAYFGSSGNSLQLNLRSTFELDSSAIVTAVREHPELRGNVIVNCQRVRDADYALDIHIPTRVFDRSTHTPNRELIHGIRSLLTETGLFPLMKYTDVFKPKAPMAAPIKKKDVLLGHVVNRIQGGLSY